MEGLRIRRERADDVAAIRALNVAAFGQQEEADLVDRLRLAADPFLSLVAELDSVLVGHIAFTAITVDGRADTPRAAGLAPMAVDPSWQRRGIGSALVASGLDACRDAGFAAVVVLGHATYYPRFGFRPASRWSLRYGVGVPDEVFMALELEPDALSSARGVVRYHTEFDRL